MRSARSPATAIRCTRAPIRASCACSRSPPRGVAGRHIEAAHARARAARRDRQAARDERLGGDSSGAARRGVPAAALKGVPILARTAGLIAHMLEEQGRPIGFVLSHAGAASDRLRRARARRLRAGRPDVNASALRRPRRRAGHLHHRPVRRDDARRPRRRRRSRSKARTGDPFRAYQGGLYSPHFQAYNRNKRSIALDLKQRRRPRALRRADRERRRLHPELPSRHCRASRRRRQAAAGAQSAARLLLDQRLRRRRPVRGSPELRLRGAGAERLL